MVRPDTPAGPDSAVKLNVVLCWHMHQPEYRDLLSGAFVLPWTYLHAIKDYVDMAAHLEAVPGARAVVNVAPVLLEQLAAYADAVHSHLALGTALPDALLATLSATGAPDASEQRLPLIAACLRANREHLINRYPRYQALALQAEAVLAGATEPAGLLEELSTWYHLAWMGESVRRDDARIRALCERADAFNASDRRTLLEVIGELIAGVVPRYRRLAEQGRIELSVTPWGHPILPILLDVRSAREQMPDAPMPADVAYPGGEARARWHVERAIEVYKQAFGRPPRGCWPSEGAVSEATLALLGEAGFRWVATGETVLRASLARAGLDPTADELRDRGFRVRDGGPVCFFRDDELSDRVGFTYARWHGDDAAANFVHYLDELSRRYAHAPGHTVAVILDGENAWEHFPFNAHYFLRGIYEQLAQHPRLNLTTFSAVLAERPPSATLPRLVTGSWVHGTLSTWIGAKAKNQAFELLCEAKRASDDVVAAGALSPAEREAADRQLGVCEGSDWAWWFADFNPAGVVADFDSLYRRHLGNLYRLIGRPVPAVLAKAFATGGGAPEQGGTMQRAQSTDSHV